MDKNGNKKKMWKKHESRYGDSIRNDYHEFIEKNNAEEKNENEEVKHIESRNRINY